MGFSRNQKSRQSRPAARVAHLERLGNPDVIRIVFIFLFIVSAAYAANEPRIVAESAVAAWEARDGVALSAISHPEFKARCRKASVFESPVLDDTLKRQTLAGGSD